MCATKYVEIERALYKNRFEKVRVEFDIPKDFRHGEKVVVKNEGNLITRLGEPASIAGDVIIFMFYKPHDVFKRRGDDIYTVIEINVEEAILGFKRMINGIDGEEIPFGMRRLPRSDFVYKMENRGLRVYGSEERRGNLVVTFNVLVEDEDVDAYKKLKGIKVEKSEDEEDTENSPEEKPKRKYTKKTNKTNNTQKAEPKTQPKAEAKKPAKTTKTTKTKATKAKKTVKK
jgi:DnaJ-class molecular chaperone